MMNRLIEIAREYQASDIHIMANAPLTLRILGEIVFLKEEIVGEQYFKEICSQLLDEAKKKILEKNGEVDFSWESQENIRLRINMYKNHSSLALAIRLLHKHIPNFRELGLPLILEKISLNEKGLIVVTGPTSSGKSTTLAAIIDFINVNCKKHIITLEDPIEYIHRNKNSLVSQREVYVDTKTFASGLKAALREDPDVILVGELRDLETIKTALMAAETGHLVLTSLHTNDAPQTINRIIDIFPSAQQAQIKLQLSLVLSAIVAQKLFKGKEGRLILATEMVIINTAIKNLIRSGKVEQINSFIQTTTTEGMHSMEKSLQKLYEQNKVDLMEVLSRTDKPELLKNLLGL